MTVLDLAAAFAVVLALGLLLAMLISNVTHKAKREREQIDRRIRLYAEVSSIEDALGHTGDPDFDLEDVERSKGKH